MGLASISSDKVASTAKSFAISSNSELRTVETFAKLNPTTTQSKIKRSVIVKLTSRTWLKVNTVCYTFSIISTLLVTMKSITTTNTETFFKRNKF